MSGKNFNEHTYGVPFYRFRQVILKVEQGIALRLVEVVELIVGWQQLR
jgi:hypothetical protein